eukprot:gb/GECG01000697.1/.p1 GENE.gb/GECG01000697.1/~~gb/GECG01000697.1/.p1  ORF type:complete len:767 (+),score=130.76 gb/GECG01000697.1/:1-2301(+)
MCMQHSGFLAYDEQDRQLVEFDIPKEKASWLVNNSKTHYKFKFKNIFGMQAKQPEVFNEVAQEAVDSALDGFNSTIFAYGQTGSGKTFTITGGAEKYDDRGIIPRTLQYIFRTIKDKTEEQYRIFVSYLEIYNENGYDLLDPKHDVSSLDELPRVTMREDADGNIHLRNLSMHQVNSEEDALNYLFLGDTNRAICETPMNPVSSRSHCIFTISLEARNVESAKVKRSKLNLVDLAGSERVSKTKTGGTALREAGYINKSLHYLQQVITALDEKKKAPDRHIPYRNSMMTTVLRDSLGGNCKTAMIATVSAEAENIDESIATCRFANQVANIKNEAYVNEETDPAVMVHQLKDKLAQKDAEIEFLKGEVGEEKELTEEEIQDLRKRIRSWMWSGKGIPRDLKIGKWTSTRIYATFALMREEAQNQLHAAQKGAPSAVMSEEEGKSEGKDEAEFADELKAEKKRLQEEVATLNEQLQRRDHEIAILVNMVKQGKGSGSGAATNKSHIEHQQQTHNRSITSTGSVSAASEPYSQVTSDRGSRRSKQSSSASSLPQLPDGSSVSISLIRDREAARDAFMNAHPKAAALEEHKAALKEKYREAKSTGAKVNEARSTIGHLKSQIESRRVQNAMHTISEGKSDESKEDAHEEDPEESRMKSEIEEQKKIYKESFDKLKNLKTEIEYTQKLLENGKLRLGQEFERWYAACSQVLDDLDQTGVSEVQSVSTSEPSIQDGTTESELPPGVKLTGNPDADKDIIEFYRTKYRMTSK